MMERSNNESKYATHCGLCMLLMTDRGDVSRLLHELGNPSICSQSQYLLAFECCSKKLILMVRYTGGMDKKGEP